eukprot:634960-Lingulodinium_polyedra.AAC.1
MLLAGAGACPQEVRGHSLALAVHQPPAGGAPQHVLRSVAAARSQHLPGRGHRLHRLPAHGEGVP